MLYKFDRILRILEKALSSVAAIMLLALMLLGTANVVARFVFNSPIIGATELSQLLMAGSFLLALAITQATGQHTAMTDLVSKYPPRQRNIVQFVVLFIALVLFAAMTWRSLLAASAMWQYGELVEVIGIPAAPFRLMLPIGAFVLCLEIVSQMLHLATSIAKKGN